MAATVSFKGYVVNAPTLSFDPSNTASGASVHVKQPAIRLIKRPIGTQARRARMLRSCQKPMPTPNSNGDQSSKSGHDTSKVYADTTVHPDELPSWPTCIRM